MVSPSDEDRKCAILSVKLHRAITTEICCGLKSAGQELPGRTGRIHT